MEGGREGGKEGRSVYISQAYTHATLRNVISLIPRLSLACNICMTFELCTLPIHAR